MPITTSTNHGRAPAGSYPPVLRRALGVAGAAALLLLGACAAEEGKGVASAGGEPAPADRAAVEEQLDGDAQALVFAECLRDNGVDMPDPGPGQQGLVDAFQEIAGDHDRATLERAFTACQDLMPQYSQEPMHEEGDMLALAECLREQGLDVSDEPFRDAHSGAIDQTEFAAAMEVCRDVLIGAGE